MRRIFFPARAPFGQEFPKEVYAEPHVLIFIVMTFPPVKLTMTCLIQLMLMRRMSLFWSGSVDIAVAKPKATTDLLDHVSKID
jgi:hypothetical protein